ncbi:hypothetical protein AF72_05260 [Xylella taiwanensis]|uniref:Uncharacterized protein n=1 Tax=Xylella taiwanensis TaxID=1444770 RepID=Z9JL30_9GAMM|nr:hypothetical protein AF72_05260 [Xylella taiwanensis]
MVLMYAMLMRCCWWLVALVAMALVFVAYSAFVVGCCAVAMVYRHVASWVRWAFCDAYRYSLARPIVAYILSPRCVKWGDNAMECDAAARRRGNK